MIFGSRLNQMLSFNSLEPRSKFSSSWLWLSKRWLLSVNLFWGLVWCMSLSIPALSQETNLGTEPRVARVQMRLSLNDEAIDVIEKGDLLTVIEERENGFLIQTVSGTKGLVAKVNAVSLAESTDIYTELISKNETEGRLYTLRAGAWWAAGKSSEAQADFDRAIELGYTAAHAYMSRGLFWAASRDYEKAILDYTKAIEKEPSEVAALVNRAAAYLASNQLEKSEQDYSAAIKLQPKSPLLYRQRAVTRKAMAKIDDAISDFSQAIEIYGHDKPQSIPSWMSRGFLHFQTANHQQAVDDFGHVIQLNPKATVAYNNRGYNLQQLGKPVDALADFDKAIELEPKYALAHQNRAWLLATTDNENLRNAEAAIASATKACELNDYQDVSDMAALAAAYSVNGEFDKAVGLQEKIVERAPPTQKKFAEEILKLYLEKKPFDPRFAKQLQIDINAPITSDAASATPIQPRPTPTPKSDIPKPLKKRAL
jgi:tetratricopeptide (TPR) repeat protein